MLDQVPIRSGQRDAGAALLKVRRAAEVIRVTVSEQHVLHVLRVECQSAQARQQHGFELVRVAGVNQQDAGGRRDGPDHGAGPADRVQVVEHTRGLDLRVVSAVCAAGIAAKEFHCIGPFRAGGREGARHAGRGTCVVRGGRRRLLCCHERARQHRDWHE